MVAIKTTSSAAAGPTMKTKRAHKAIALRVCSHPACTKSPYFGWHGETAVSCVAHKEPGALRVALCPVSCWCLLLLEISLEIRQIFNIFAGIFAKQGDDRDRGLACMYGGVIDRQLHYLLACAILSLF